MGENWDRKKRGDEGPTEKSPTRKREKPEHRKAQEEKSKGREEFHRKIESRWT